MIKQQKIGGQKYCKLNSVGSIMPYLMNKTVINLITNTNFKLKHLET